MRQGMRPSSSGPPAYIMDDSRWAYLHDSLIIVTLWLNYWVMGKLHITHDHHAWIMSESWALLWTAAISLLTHSASIQSCMYVGIIIFHMPWFWVSGWCGVGYQEVPGFASAWGIRACLLDLGRYSVTCFIKDACHVWCMHDVYTDGWHLDGMRTELTESAAWLDHRHNVM